MGRISKKSDIRGKKLDRKKGACHTTSPLSTPHPPTEHRSGVPEKTQPLSENCGTGTMVSLGEKEFGGENFRLKVAKLCFFQSFQN